MLSEEEKKQLMSELDELATEESVINKKVVELTAKHDDIESELIQVLSELSQKKGWLTASTVKQFSRQFKNVSPDQIRQMFLYMAAKGIGKTQKADSALEWSI